MFCPKCSSELSAAAKFCVKCGLRIEASTTAPRASRSFCVYCAKLLDSSDKFCSHCGHEVVDTHKQVSQIASDIAAKKLEKHAERYSQMATDELIRLSVDLSELTEIAQKALITEIANRGLKDPSPILEQPNPSEPPVTQSVAEVPASWDYEKMSDEELQQLCAAYQKLHQPISDSLRSELDLRASRRVQAVLTPSSSPTQIAPILQVTASGQISVGVSPQKSTSAPYARFVGQLLLSCLCASVGVFALFDAFARDTTDFAAEGLSILFTLLFGWLVWITWKSILKNEPRTESKSRRRIRNALVTSAIFVLLYLGLAALLGSVIGQNRAEAIQFNVDVDRQKGLADRLTKARSAVSNTIRSYLAMYSEIEPDVKNYSLTLSRVREDLDKYDNKFPAQREDTHKYIASIEKEIRRSNLLTKQIAVAKQIGLLDENQQWAAWQSEMLPLLKEEDALDQSK